MNDKEFMELKVLLGNNYNCTDRSYCLDRQAKALIEEGYHRTIWHKVAEGDLPKKSGYYYCHYRGVHSGEYYEANYEMCWNSEKFMTDRSNEVIAWTELPTYEE